MALGFLMNAPNVDERHSLVHPRQCRRSLPFACLDRTRQESVVWLAVLRRNQKSQPMDHDPVVVEPCTDLNALVCVLLLTVV